MNRSAALAGGLRLGVRTDKPVWRSRTGFYFGLASASSFSDPESYAVTLLVDKNSVILTRTELDLRVRASMQVFSCRIPILVILQCGAGDKLHGMTAARHANRHFQLLSLFALQPRFALDWRRSDAAYQMVQSQVHPDRFASGQRRRTARGDAMGHARQRGVPDLQADPLKRATYLCELNGVDVADGSEYRRCRGRS